MSLTFRGVTLDDVSSGLLFEIARGFLAAPAVRGSDFTVAARAGRSAGNRLADTNTVLLEGVVLGDDPADFLAKCLVLYAILDESGVAPGDLVVTGPSYGLGAGVTATIACRVKNWIAGDIKAGAAQTFSIEFESVDPYWVVA